MSEALNVVRLEEKEVTLNNQNIIELGYMAKDLIALIKLGRGEVTFDQASCYSGVFDLMKKLLESVDPEYLTRHQNIKEFYDRDRSEELANIIITEPDVGPEFDNEIPTEPDMDP